MKILNSKELYSFLEEMDILLNITKAEASALVEVNIMMQRDIAVYNGTLGVIMEDMFVPMSIDDIYDSTMDYLYGAVKATKQCAIDCRLSKECRKSYKVFYERLKNMYDVLEAVYSRTCYSHSKYAYCAN